MMFGVLVLAAGSSSGVKIDISMISRLESRCMRLR